jgi:acyl dehydratase
MALFYADLAEGQEFTTPARTITETDVVQFSGLTGDCNPIHTDAEFAAGTRYGQRIVHGLFGVSVCIGLMSRTGIFEGSAVALLGVDEWRFRAPIFIGDTVRCRIHILGKRLTSSGETGVVQRRFELLNQRGDIVQDGRMDVMVYVSAPEASAAGVDESTDSGVN